MPIDPIARATASYASQLPEKQSLNLEAEAAAKPAAPAPEDSVTLTQETARQAMGKIGEHVEGRHALAKTLQEGVAQLERVAEAMEPLKTELYKIIKNYPPFGIDNEDRREILRSYSALRKEIDSMTVPPPPEPFYQAHSSSLSSYFDPQGRLALQDVPELPLDASDNRVHAVAAAVEGKIASFKASPQVFAGLIKVE